MKKKHWLGTVLAFSADCKPQTVLSVICAIISVAGGIVPYLAVYEVIILFLEGAPAAADIWFWSAVCLAGHIVKLLFYAISTMLAHYSAYTIIENMRLRMADRLMAAPLGAVLNQSVGKLKNTIVDRVETIELPLAHLIPEGISNLLLPLAVFGYLIVIDWRMALASLITVPIAAVAYAFMMRSFNKQYADYMESSNHVNGVIVEFIEGIEVIKAFNQSSSSYEKYEKAVKSFKAYTLNWFRSTWKPMNFGGAVLPSTLLGTMPAGMYLYLTGALTPAELAMCLVLGIGIVAPLTSFTVFVNDAKAIEYAVNEADQFLNMPELPQSAVPARLEGYEIELNRVAFSYGGDYDEAGGKDINEPGTTKESLPETAPGASGQALSGVSLKLPEGSFTALVGPSGSGKSTVARLIARFWDADNGAISIGGADIRRLPLSQLADTVSFVTQDNFLFNCSLMENIRLGNPQASNEEVIRAAKAACCDEFISRLDRGYDTPAGEAGGRLSGGEKQRIAIARAILKNAPIVILDEATAFTDPENEHKLQQSIAALTRGKTLLVIAHRLSTIRNADRIIVMNKGRVAETGTHEELVAGGGLYRQLWDAHTGARNWVAGEVGINA